MKHFLFSSITISRACPQCGETLTLEWNVWSNLEKYFETTGDSMPKCVKEILIACGYVTSASIQNISVESINQIENEINLNARHVIQQFNYYYSELYKKQNTFKLLPAQRDLILYLPKINFQNLKHDHKDSDEMLIESINQHPGVSVILREMIKTAVRNHKLTKKRAQYSDIIRYFSTYVFILCGRATYTVLHDNLPLPSIPTVCA